MLEKVWIDLHWVKELELAFGTGNCHNWLSALERQVTLRWIQIALWCVILVTETRFAIELVMCRINGFLRVSVHSHGELRLNSLLECFTSAHHWLITQDVQNAGEGDVVPVHILEDLVKFYGQVPVQLVYLILFEMLSVVWLIVVEESIIMYRLNETFLRNISVSGLLLYKSLTF